jgi:hypothetical protein
MSDIENELDMFKQLSKKYEHNCPGGLIELHTEFLVGIKRDIHRIETKVDDLGIVSIVNGSNDGTPTMFQRNVFFQTVYNEIQEIKEERARRAAVKYSIKNFNWWAKNLVPVIAVVCIIVMFVLLAVGQQRLANEIKDIVIK